MNIPIESIVAKAPQALLPVELHQLILDYTDFLTQIRIRCVNKLFYLKLEIRDFFHIAGKYQDLLTDNILRSYPFIRKICVRISDPKITTLNNFTHLEQLHAGALTDISDKDIRDLTNLTFLNAYHNPLITNVNHLTKLKVLDATMRSGIDDVGLYNLNLKELHVWGNIKITNLNHMTTLEILDVSGECGIGDEGIIELNLRELYARNNPKITKIKHMTRLEVLCAGGSCGISEEDIQSLNLKELYMDYNPKYTRPSVPRKLTPK